MGSEEQEEMNHQNTSVNDKSTPKGSAKRRQGRWKGKIPCMIIATSEGTFFTSKKEKLVEEKACISFSFFFTLRYFSCPVLTAETREITSISSWSLAQSTVPVSGQRIIKAHTHNTPSQPDSNNR